MRLLYVTDQLSRRGGAEQHLRDVLRAFAPRHDVTLAYGARRAASEPPDGVRAVRLRGLAAPADDPRDLAALPELLAGADVVHAQNVMNPLALRAIRDSGRAIVTVQDHRVFCPGAGKRTPAGAVCDALMSPETCAPCFDDAAYAAQRIALTAARRAALRGARLVVLSRYMARELARTGLGDAAVIPPWVPLGGRPTLGGPLLLAGRLVAHKACLDGWRAWQRSGAQRPLLVAGEGRLASELARRLSPAAMLGWLSRPELRRRLHEAFALLMPSAWEEPFGIVGAEALAEGTPVILMASGGTAEWATAGCVTVDRGDVVAMAAAIAALDADPGAALRLGAAGQQAMQRFAEPPLRGALEALYREVAG